MQAEEEEEEREQVLGGVEQVRRLGNQAEQAGVGEVRVELATQDYSDNLAEITLSPLPLSSEVYNWTRVTDMKRT